ncbi:MAG TPA: nuclear transport factor 2 family protein [Myxococcales bacterium]|nr:nuclear transport factor 2 family protein [Myxococcales bacterium]HIM01502.1 nuclear transport factor 2 family protein [Myxococcales bacterium]
MANLSDKQITAFQELLDRREIDDLLIRYATAVDTKDWDLWETCFTEDAFVDYESAGGIKGKRPEVRSWLEKTLVMFPMTQHVVSNRVVEIDGDNATARSVFYNPMGLAQGESRQMLFFDGGYYNDKLIKTDAGWKIVQRIEESSYSTRLSEVMKPMKQR